MLVRKEVIIKKVSLNDNIFEILTYMLSIRNRGMWKQKIVTIWNRSKSKPQPPSRKACSTRGEQPTASHTFRWGPFSGDDYREYIITGTRKTMRGDITQRAHHASATAGMLFWTRPHARRRFDWLLFSVIAVATLPTTPTWLIRATDRVSQAHHLERLEY